jgi:hypothetical protein
MAWSLLLRRTFFARQERGWAFTLLAASLFAYLQIRGHMSHEMWKDELHCWAIGRNATGLWDLLTGERRYDGHPFLWYYVLHWVSLVHRSYIGLHVITIMLATSAAILWLRYAPLPRTVRVLLLGSYYFVYEYAVISRSYILGIAITFTFCALYRPYRVRYLPLAALLGLLAATSMYGTLMALSLGLFLFTRNLRVWKPDALDDRLRVPLPAQWLAGLVVFVAGLGVVAISTWPPADARYVPTGVFEFTSATFHADFGRYWAALFPFRTLTEWDWLTTDHLGSSSEWVQAKLTWLGFGWFALWLVALRRCPWLAIAYATGIFMMMAVQHGIYPAGLRHLGHYVVLLLACVWLYGQETRLRSPPLLQYVLLTAMLGVQVATGFAALQTDEKTLFSGTIEAAEFMKAHHLEQRAVVAYTDESTSPLAIVLDRPFLFVGTGETSDVVVAHNRIGTGDHAKVVETAAGIARASGPTLMVVNTALNAAIPSGFASQLLYQSKTPLTMFDEAFWIYELTAPSPKP